MEGHSFAATYSSIKSLKLAEHLNCVVGNKKRLSQNTAIITIQCFILLCAVMYVCGHMVYWSSAYQFQEEMQIEAWWYFPGYIIEYFLAPGSPGRTGMILPTHVVLFCFIPLLASVILVECVDRPIIYRISSQHIMHVGASLRRRPVILWNKSKLCVYSYGEL
uniref:AlNc14C1007G12710 protein n=1 Tax=Albugo laibachii Nc14 TaxID=890382 RepID=F0X2E9_9STRA|nr:AlNc14C1007G12710 [Albugo laibachii Nc14]|eukprot:CCA28039.1 AlNc14C1007G12710 [Albugo laibachii Nc14]